ncbi:MAG: hypothetical protein ACYTEK_28120, partial [Planctomycetota bacterium]
RLKATVLKTVVPKGTGGSNPSCSVRRRLVTRAVRPCLSLQKERGGYGSPVRVCTSTQKPLRSAKRRGTMNVRCSDKLDNKQNNKPAADPDLAVVVEAWPGLPPAVRSGIVAIVGASKEQ